MVASAHGFHKIMGQILHKNLPPSGFNLNGIKWEVANDLLFLLTYPNLIKSNLTDTSIKSHQNQSQTTLHLQYNSRQPVANWQNP